MNSRYAPFLDDDWDQVPMMRSTLIVCVKCMKG